MKQEYYEKFEGVRFAPGTRNVAERIQNTAPFPVPDNVALILALAVTAESLIELSVLGRMRMCADNIDSALKSVTSNFIVAIQAVCLDAGLTFEQFAELLSVAERAMVADLKAFHSEPESETKH